MNAWFASPSWDVLLSTLVASSAVLVACLLLCRTLWRHRPVHRAAACTSTTIALLAIPFLAWGAHVAGWGLRPTAAHSHDAAAATVAVAPGHAGGPVFVPRLQPKFQTGPQGPTVPARDSRQPEEGGITTASLLAGAWLSTSLLLLVPIAVSWQRSRQLRNSVSSVDCPAWQQARQQVDTTFDVTVPYALGASAAVAMPIAVGLRRPCVILPMAMATAPPDTAARAVLAHEVGHVLRRDSLRAVLSRVALALHWHHPLAWWLQREFAVAREEVCDNHALAVTSPHELAEALLAFTLQSDGGPTGRLRGALAHSVRGWNLEQRVQGLLSPRRDGARGESRTSFLQALAVALVAAAGVVVACTPMREVDRSADGPTLDETSGRPHDPGPTVDGPAAEDDAPVLTDSRPLPELEAVLQRFGFDQMTRARLEFVWDHGGHGDAFRLADGRKTPMETEWVFDDPRPVLEALAQARTTSFKSDAWPEAKAAFCLYGELPDGRRLQISFHSSKGSATVSRSTLTDALEGGAWRFTGGDDALIALMQSVTPALVELPLLEASVWTVADDRAPAIHEIRALRSAAELQAALAPVSIQSDPSKPRTLPEQFDFANGVALLIRPPPSDPPHGLRWGTPVLRNGNVLEQLVFDGPSQKALAGRAPVMLLFVEVQDPQSLAQVVLSINGNERVTRELR